MRKIYLFLFTFTLSFIGIVNTNAQQSFTGSLTQPCQTGWANDRVGFKLSEVASALDTDVATLTSALDAFFAANPETFKTDDNSDKELYFTTEAGTPVAEYPNAVQSYSSDNNGFWMNDQAVPLAYNADGYSWYAFADYDAETDEFAICVGQLPNHFVNGANLSTTLVLHFNSKTVSFIINVTVEPKPVIDAETDLSKLETVINYEFPLEFIIGKSYEGKSYSTTLESLYDALETTAEELDGKITESTFTQALVGEEVEGVIQYSWSNQLVIPSEASDGSWYGRYTQYDEATGTETIIEMNAPKTWSGSADNLNTFYLQNISLANGEFTIGSAGQYPGVLKEGDTDYTYLYIINGNKAAKVKVYVVMKKPEEINPDDYVKVGETTVEVTAEINDAYGTKSFNVDMAPILEALEVETYEEDFYTWASEGAMSDNHTEGSKNFGSGYYYNDEGFICQWGSSAAFFIAPENGTASIQDGTYKIGQMAGHFTNITEATTVSADLIFKVAEKYYVVHVIYTVTPPEGKKDNPEDNFEIVSVQPLYKELVPSNLYYGESNDETKANMEMELDMTAVRNLLGEGSLEFWGLKAPADAESYGTLTTSTGYGTNSGFNGGFWMGMPKDNIGEEYVDYVWVDSWAQNAYGIEWNLSTGRIGFDIHPGAPAHQVGDTYKSVFYLENTTTHQAIKYVLTVAYVDAYTAKGEEAGREEVAGVLSVGNQNVDEDFFYVGEPISDAVYQTLGIDPTEYEDCVWMVTNSSGKLIDFPDGLVGETAAFDQYGYYIDLQSPNSSIDDVAFTLCFYEDENRFAMGFLDLVNYSDPNSLSEYISGKVFKTTVALKYADKYYVFDVVAGDEETITGISETMQDNPSTRKIYDINGREIIAPVHGIYIINGKKVMVK